MDASVRAMAGLGYRQAALWVLERNERARSFYGAHGWRPDGGRSETDYGGVMLAALRYVREIAPAAGEAT